MKEKNYKPEIINDNEINKKCGIYQIRNLIDGKLYVGSAINLKFRKYNGHFNKLKNGKHHNNHLQNSYDINGEDNFVFEIIEFCEPKDRLQLEQYWIDRLNVLNKNFGYNIAKKAGSGPNLKGHIFSKEHNEKISKYRTGMKFSEKHCKNISESRKGLNIGIENDKSVQVVCLENNTIYGSMLEAIRKLNLSKKIDIGRVLSKKGYTAGGLHWMRADEYLKASKEEIEKILSIKQYSQPKQMKKVICLNTMNVYNSIKEASIQNNTSSASILKCCKGEYKTVTNKITKDKLNFMYYNEWLNRIN